MFANLSDRAGVGKHGTRRHMEMVEMRIVIPPGQRLPEVSAHVSLSRTEATELRDALDHVLATGRSDWNVGAEWAEIEAALMLELELSGEYLDPAVGPR
jgi:hypothetical protein